MIAIHPIPGSFSDNWISYCEKNNIPYKIVNCYSSDIIFELKDCKALMWNWALNDFKAQLFARQLTESAELMGIVVFPNSNTCWHYDDKLGQKYLLEGIHAQIVPTYVFYDIKEAINWSENTVYPKVFKLRGGAGSHNVRLVSNISEAKYLIRKAFNSGFRSRSRYTMFKERIWRYKRDRNLKSMIYIFKGIWRIFIPAISDRKLPREKNYVYFQDFIPNNNYDIRVIVIGTRAFAIKRMVRKNDFRASGSGIIIHDKNQIPIDCLRISFDLTHKLQAQCLAYDYVFEGDSPLLTEISYDFVKEGYTSCPGYWDNDLNWHEGMFKPEWFMIEDLLEKIE